MARVPHERNLVEIPLLAGALVPTARIRESKHFVAFVDPLHPRFVFESVEALKLVALDGKRKNESVGCYQRNLWLEPPPSK